MISRVTMRRSGLAKYLEDGKRADSPLERNAKDKVIPLYGSLSSLKRAEDYCNKKKNWKANYEHITISFSDEDIAILEAMNDIDYEEALKDITITMIKHRTSGYDIDNEVIAYGELHDPKLKEEINPRSGVIQKRRKHIHIGISYLNPLSDTKLQTTFYNNSYISDTIDKYIAKKHGLTYVREKEPDDSNIDKPSQMAINRNAIKEAVKDFTTKKELYSYLDNNNIKYDFTNKKSKTKQSNIFVYNENGRKIHLRGKDFANIEVLFNDNYNNKEKKSYIKELKSKSLKELGDILERYYKTNRIPLIESKRSNESKKILDDIYEQTLNDKESDKVNSFTSLQEKIFYKHYKQLITTNLNDYYVNVDREKKVEFTNKLKDIKVTDFGGKIVANSSNSNLEDKVKLMIDIAIAKGWDIATIKVNGSNAFKKEAYGQIASIIAQQTPSIKEKRENNFAILKSIDRPKSKTQFLAKENKEKREAQKSPLATLKKDLNAKKVLEYVMEKYRLKSSLYEIVGDNKINNLSNRQKPKNVIDFLQKEINLSTREAIDICTSLYKEQRQHVDIKTEPLNNIKERGEDIKMPLSISINKSKERNALNNWEVVEVDSYSKLSTLLKEFPYSGTQFNKKRAIDNIMGYNNILIYDIDNDPADKQLNIEEAKLLLKSKGISAMLLPSKSHQIEKFTKSGKSKGIKDRFRIIIPINETLSITTNKESIFSRDTSINKELYREFQSLTTKALGIDKCIDKQALNDMARYYYPSPLTAVPIVIKADRVMDITNLKQKAIENVERAKAEREAKRIKLEEIKANLNLHRSVSKTNSNHLTYVSVIDIMNIPITTLIKHYEGGDIKEEGHYSYIKTDNAKYSIIDDKLAHDFKTDITYNSLTYLQRHLETNNINMIARELEKSFSCNYIRVNIETLKTVFTEALKSATNDKTLEEGIKTYFKCDYCKLEGDALKVADQTIKLSDIDISKIEVINILKDNRNKVKDKEEAMKRGEAPEKKANVLNQTNKNFKPTI